MKALRKFLDNQRSPKYSTWFQIGAKHCLEKINEEEIFQSLDKENQNMVLLINQLLDNECLLTKQKYTNCNIDPEVVVRCDDSQSHEGMLRQSMVITETCEAVTVSEENQQEQQRNDLKNQEEQPKDTSIFQETMEVSNNSNQRSMDNLPLINQLLKDSTNEPLEECVSQDLNRRNKLIDNQTKDDSVNEFENQEEQFMDEREKQKTLQEESKDITIFQETSNRISQPKSEPEYINVLKIMEESNKGPPCDEHVNIENSSGKKNSGSDWDGQLQNLIVNKEILKNQSSYNRPNDRNRNQPMQKNEILQNGKDERVNEETLNSSTSFLLNDSNRSCQPNKKQKTNKGNGESEETINQKPLKVSQKNDTVQTKSKGNSTKTKHLFKPKNTFGQRNKLLPINGEVDPKVSVQHPRNMKEFSQLLTQSTMRCLPESSENRFKKFMKSFLQHKAQHNCVELTSKKIGQCSCLKSLLSRENQIDNVVGLVTEFWKQSYNQRKKDFETTISKILKKKLECSRNPITDPTKIRLKGRLFSLSNYQVCPNAYLACLGIGYSRYLTVRKNILIEISSKDTSDV